MQKPIHNHGQFRALTSEDGDDEDSDCGSTREEQDRQEMPTSNHIRTAGAIIKASKTISDCNCIGWDEDEDNEHQEECEVNVAEQIVELEAALDSGTVEHVANAHHLPASTMVVKKPGSQSRDFVGANGSPIANYGLATIDMIQNNGGVVGMTTHVADVTRPFHPTGNICDSVSKRCPDGHEVLYTKDKAIVLPAGALSPYLSKTRHIATYTRTDNGKGRRGLYVSKMKIKASAPKSGFTRQGQAP